MKIILYGLLLSIQMAVPILLSGRRALENNHNLQEGRNKHHSYYYEGDPKAFTSQESSLNLSKLPELGSNKSTLGIPSENCTLEGTIDCIKENDALLDRLLQSQLKLVDSKKIMFQPSGMRYVKFKKDLSCLGESLKTNSLCKRNKDSHTLDRHRKSLPQLRRNLNNNEFETSGDSAISQMGLNTKLDQLYDHNPARSISIQTISPELGRLQNKRALLPQISYSMSKANITLESAKKLKTLEPQKKNIKKKVPKPKIENTSRSIIPPMKARRSGSRSRQVIKLDRKKSPTVLKDTDEAASPGQLSTVQNYGNFIMKG